MLLRERPTTPDGSAAAGSWTPAAIAAELLTYLPTEAVAAYTGLLPFFVVDDQPLDSQEYGSRWALAVGVGILAVLFSVGTFRAERRRANNRFFWPLRRTTFVILAYAGWVFMVPGSPFADFSWYSPQLGAGGGLVAALLVTLAQLWLGEPEQAGD